MARMLEKQEQKMSMECSKELSYNNLLQASSDGPFVYLAAFDILNDERKNLDLQELVHIGTYRLHIFHCSLKHSENGSAWGINNILKAMYKIFDESPSRRTD